ncbi:MAG: branched-chain amino acid ABC transporter permease [Acidimicrobiia bacterium]
MTPGLLILAQESTVAPSEFGRMVVNAISLGAIYAVLALGFVIIFKATQVLNFAHGAISAMGAFLIASFATIINVPGRWMEGSPEWLQWSLSVVFALVVAALIGMALERMFLRPMVGEALFALAIVTLGIDIIVRTITNDFIGLTPRPMGDPFGLKIVGLGCEDGGFIGDADLIELCSVRVPWTTVFQVTVTVILVVAVAMFFRSRTGIAMKATAWDQEVARAQGISVGRIFATAWAIGAVLAAIGGLFISLFPRRPSGVDQFTAFFAFRAFPAIILGGLDSILGAIVGGFAIGFAESASSTYLTFEWLGTGFGGVVPYIVMLLVLLIRPYGLFGTEQVRRV